MPTAVPRAWLAEGSQNFVTIANHHTASTSIRKIDHDVATDACRGRKNDTLDALLNPDPSQLRGRRMPAAAKTEPNDICQFRGKRGRKIKISVCRHGQDVCQTGIFPDTDLISTAQSILAGRDFTHSRLFFETRIDCPHTWRHKATAVQSGPLALVTSSGGKYRNATDRKKSPWSEVAPAISSASCFRAARPSFKLALQPAGAEIRQ